MAHNGVAFLRATGFEKESHTHVLGAGAAEAELSGKVAAERAGDEEQGLAVFDRWIELAMGAREQGRAPWRERVRLHAARQEHRVSPGAAELALQLTLPEGGHRAQGAQAEQVQAFELFLIERELVR